MKNFTDKTLHEKFKQYGLNAREWMRKCALLLPEIQRREIWKKKGFESIYHYAAVLAGMSRYSVNEALRILGKIEDKPALKKVVEEKGINAVRPVVIIATPETDKFWARKASEMSKNALTTFVKEFRQLSDIKVNRLPGQSLPEEEKVVLAIKLKKETFQKLEKIKGEREWDEVIEEFARLREEKLNFEKPETVEKAGRAMPVKIKNFVLKRSNGCCEFPGCNKQSKILHHLDRFSLYHTHDPDRIFALCEGHERLMHLGLVENEGQGPQFWKIRLEADRFDPIQDVDLVVEKFRS